MTRKTLLSFVAAAIACLWGGGSVSAQSLLQKVTHDGYIRVGFPNQVPYAYANEKGQLTGVDAEIAQRVIDRMGIKQMDGVLTEFASLIPGLKAQRFDLVLAMFVNPARCAEVAFTEPVYSVGQGLLVAPGNPKGITGYGNMVSGDARIAVMAGAVQASYMKKLGVADARVQNYPDMTTAVAAVASGRADVFAISALPARRLLSSGGGKLQLLDNFPDPVIDGKPARGFDAFAVRKTDTDLLNAFNAALAKVMAEPDYVKILEKYGLTKADVPKTTTAELCK